MNNEGAIALAAIALAATTVAGLVGTLKWATNKLSSDLQAHSNSQLKVAKSMDRMATATKEGSEQAEKRNGHLADLIIQQGNNVQAIADVATKNIVSAVQNVGEQHIEHQEVNEAILKKTIIKEGNK